MREDRATPTAVDPQAVREELESILASGPFRTSKQCQDMLRYVVEHSLKHEHESLRERIIGIEVFGRNHEYDTASDPVVRLRAADIRKRLAQYYQGVNPLDCHVHIAIPSGSYRALFEAMQDARLPEHPSEPIDSLLEQVEVIDEHVSVPNADLPLLIERPGRSLRMPLPVRALALLLIVVATGWLGWRTLRRPVDTVDQFWGPVFRDSRSVLVYTGANAVYRFTNAYLDQYRQEHHLENHGPEFFVDLKPGEKIDGSDLIASQNSFITSGDSEAAARLVVLFTRHDKPFQLRYGSDIDVGDLHDSPVVLIGAFNNNWTLDLTSDLEFTFQNGVRIEDKFNKARFWTVNVLPDGKTLDDYAVVSRLINLKSGRIVITVAGIGQFGTEAAAEFLTNSQELADVVRTAPADWRKKNMQVVLHVKVVDESVDSTNVVASRFW